MEQQANDPKPEQVTLERRGPEEGEVLGITYTFNGPAQIVWREGKRVQEQMPKPVKPGWEEQVMRMKPQHGKAFRIILALLEQRAQQNIVVPVFMMEMKQYANKQTIKELERMGLIEIQLARFQKNGKLAEAVSVLWLTGAGEELAKQAKASAQEAAGESE